MNGDALHVEVRGHGPALMLLHGFAGTAQSLGVLADDLSADHTTIRPDLPGHGRSPGAWRDDGRDFDHALSRLVDALGRCGHADADWIGYSMGARLALGCAVRHPASVRSLVLIGARAGIADPDARAARRAADATLADGIESGGVESFLEAWLAQPMFATLRALGPDALERQRRERLGHDAAGLAGSLRRLGPGAQPPLFGELGSVRVPVLLVVGALDAPFVAQARELARLLPDARLCEIPGAGHAAHVERPAAVLAAIRDFLRCRGQSPRRVELPVEETVQ
jgi:2-succinyl-6-hydroxy-2,4-cyclohexadiene-1-carboxylate synthase